MMTQDATPAARIAAWRSRHTIEPVEGTHPTFGTVWRCAVDGLRVHWVLKAWQHDKDEAIALMDAEYGGSWGFPKSEQERKAQAIERIVEERNPIVVESNDGYEVTVDDDWNVEGDPAWNGAFDRW